MTPDEQAQFIKATSIFIKEQVAKAVEERLAEFKFLGSWTRGKSLSATQHLLLRRFNLDVYRSFNERATKY